MSDFNVTIQDNFYNVNLDESQKYKLGVDYEIPSKAIQYNNIILDNISASFNGVNKTFPLNDNGEAYYPINSQQLIVGKNNLILEPEEDYAISQNSIVFASAPNPGDDVFIIALVTTADLTRTINLIVDSGSFDMNAGDKGRLTLDVTGQLESWRIYADQIGDLSLDIKKTNYQSYPNSTSIVNGDYPSLINTNKGFDDDLSNWNVNIFAGDILTFEVRNSVDIRRFLISLKLKL
jgi:hypothetical protein